MLCSCWFNCPCFLVVLYPLRLLHLRTILSLIFFFCFLYVICCWLLLLNPEYVSTVCFPYLTLLSYYYQTRFWSRLLICSYLLVYCLPLIPLKSQPKFVNMLLKQTDTSAFNYNLTVSNCLAFATIDSFPLNSFSTLICPRAFETMMYSVQVIPPLPHWFNCFSHLSSAVTFSRKTFLTPINIQLLQ